MRSPSHLRLRVSRAVALRTALAAVLTALVLIPAAEAAPGDRGLFVSQGVGRQNFAGGGGVAYGTVFSGGSLVVVDYSESHDMQVSAPVEPTVNVDGSRTFVPAGGMQRFSFKIQGTLYRVTVTGSSALNGANVYGRLQVRGKGKFTVNGKKQRWSAPAIRLGKVPKDIRPLFELAAHGDPPPAPPAPPLPPVPPPTDTTTSTG